MYNKVFCCKIRPISIRNGDAVGKVGVCRLRGEAVPGFASERRAAQPRAVARLRCSGVNSVIGRPLTSFAVAFQEAR